MEKTNLPFENQAVLNPACLADGDARHLYYRAVRHGNFSTIGYCRLEGTRVVERWNKPLLEPEYLFERHGVEDPRVVKIEDAYYLFYAAYDGQNVHAAYAIGRDPLHFEKQGVISPTLYYEEAVNLFRGRPVPQRYFWYEEHYQEAISKQVLLWEKDVFAFPQKINGKFMLIHRLMPGIQLLAVNSLNDLTAEFWKQQLRKIDESILLNPQYWFETRKIGGGCPPILTDKGWLFIYHAVQDTPHGNVYRAAAALLDKDNPQHVLGRLTEPLFSPTEPWELRGQEPSIVFPTGAFVSGDELTIFYGAADICIAARVFSLSELVTTLYQQEHYYQT